MKLQHLTSDELINKGYTRLDPNISEVYYVFQHQSLPSFIYIHRGCSLLQYLDYGRYSHDYNEDIMQEISNNHISISISIESTARSPIVSEEPNYGKQSLLSEYKPTTSQFMLYYCGAIVEIERLTEEPFK